jgi:hypothetical protein
MPARTEKRQRDTHCKERSGRVRRDRLRTRPHRCFVSLYRVRRSEAQFVDRGRHKTLLRLGIVPALDGNASAMPLHAGVSKQVDRVSGVVTHTPRYGRAGLNRPDLAAQTGEPFVQR